MAKLARWSPLAAVGLCNFFLLPLAEKLGPGGVEFLLLVQLGPLNGYRFPSSLVDATVWTTLCLIAGVWWAFRPSKLVPSWFACVSVFNWYLGGFFYVSLLA